MIDSPALNALFIFGYIQKTSIQWLGIIRINNPFDSINSAMFTIYSAKCFTIFENKINALSNLKQKNIVFVFATPHTG